MRDPQEAGSAAGAMGDGPEAQVTRCQGWREAKGNERLAGSDAP